MKVDYDIQMDFYDKNKIGKLIAWRGDNFVYEYGSDEVIKFSKFNFFLGLKKAKKKAYIDYKICKKFFGKFLLATKIVSSPNGKHIALVQPKISGNFLRPEDLKREIVRLQFQEFVRCYYSMLQAGNNEVDLIGQKGAFLGCMSNVFITRNGELVFFDALMLDPGKYFILVRPFFFLLFKVAVWRQNSIIRLFLNQGKLSYKQVKA